MPGVRESQPVVRPYEGAPAISLSGLGELRPCHSRGRVRISISRRSVGPIRAWVAGILICSWKFPAAPEFGPVGRKVPYGMETVADPARSEAIFRLEMESRDGRGRHARIPLEVDRPR